MKTLFEKGYGDSFIKIEEDQEKNLYLSSNADTRLKIEPSLYKGWAEQSDPEVAKNWLVELENLFSDPSIALKYAQAAGAAI